MEMETTTTTTSTSTSTSTTTSLSQSALENLAQTESEIETTSAYFEPKPSKTYVIRVDLDKHKIKPVQIENERFKDAQGRPLKRYEFVIAHVNNQKEQIWTVSKTVCLQILGELRKGFTVLRILRTGTDRSTTYSITGVQ
jgi:hypothetical protein